MITTPKKKNKAGDAWQKNIEASLLPTTYFYRLRDSAGAWSNGEGSRFTPSNLCDYIIFHNGDLFMTEAKSTKGKSLPFSNLKRSQIAGFGKLKEKKKTVEHLHGIFLIEFSEVEECFAISSDHLLEYMESKERKSFPIDWISEKGVKLERQKGKRKRIEIENGLDKLKQQRNKE